MREREEGRGGVYRYSLGSPLLNNAGEAKIDPRLCAKQKIIEKHKIFGSLLKGIITEP